MSNRTIATQPTVLTVLPFAVVYDGSVDVAAVENDDSNSERSLDPRAELHEDEVMLTEILFTSHSNTGEAGHWKAARPPALVGLGIRAYPSFGSVLPLGDTPDEDSDKGDLAEKGMRPSCVAEGTERTNPKPQETDYFNTYHSRRQHPQSHGSSLEDSPGGSEYEMISTPDNILTSDILDELETLAVQILAFTPTISTPIKSLNLPYHAKDGIKSTASARTQGEVTPDQSSYGIAILYDD
ncbi:hypothetical protein FRC19_011365 [Serendipita sp. 401]|nr:hypothetical protein FRC19_011365 [Serendipita sp. 401]